ncbi:hypothetical protein RFN29_28910 [Mesorhizobium sp. VK22B]|uniref:Transposase n=1 Tax=Mesorhizobium captivum TaxID=3072319 RepID=A0ABU4Z8I4_9HYPH|nr:MULTISPECIES: hypothetical protein [unclassified Mesorhizobium]MDX8495580.1 hypothetical protein [Mesorhizobium sp. VK22B]MDX8508982.1 hypothetical protein [Mesorhizobium sp. VK22E]
MPAFFARSSSAACLERLFLPAGADHLREFEDTAQGLTVYVDEFTTDWGVLFTG